MKKIFVFAVFALISTIACANPWAYHGPKRDVVTLIVTANYEKPRLIAELIQYENRQPFLLLPANGSGKIYFCPPTHLGKSKVVAKEKLGSILAFIAPEQIFVLGNEKYVPASYVKELRQIAPVVVINADNWQKAADTIAPMLNLSRLPDNFRKLNDKLESGRLYVPKKKEVRKTEDDPLLAAEEDKKDAADFDEPKLPSNKKTDKKTAPKKNVKEKKVQGTKNADVAPLA